jgi:hypothetical protein
MLACAPSARSNGADNVLFALILQEEGAGQFQFFRRKLVEFHFPLRARYAS